MKAVCKNCGKSIHSTPWTLTPWSHGPLWDNNRPNCEPTTVAEPKEGK